MKDSALLETIMVATEAEAEALLAAGRVPGTPTDAVIAASEGEIKHHYPRRITEGGRRVRDAVLKGVPEALRRYESGSITRNGIFHLRPVSRVDTGWNGCPTTARIIPAISRGRLVTSATVRSTRARTKSSANGQRVPQTAGSGTVRAAPCCTSLRSRIT